MKLTGKHTGIVVALSIFCLPSLVIVYFQLAQWRQQHRMEIELENQQLQTISIPLGEVNWFKVKKEVIVDGKLFDVKEYHQEGGKVLLTGLFDEKETEIKNNISLIRKTEENQKKNGELARHFFNILLFSSPYTIELPKKDENNDNSIPYEATSRLASVSFAVLTPPPEA